MLYLRKWTFPSLQIKLKQHVATVKATVSDEMHTGLIKYRTRLLYKQITEHLKTKNETCQYPEALLVTL